MGLWPGGGLGRAYWTRGVEAAFCAQSFHTPDLRAAIILKKKSSSGRFAVPRIDPPPGGGARSTVTNNRSGRMIAGGDGHVGCDQAPRRHDRSGAGDGVAPGFGAVTEYGSEFSSIDNNHLITALDTVRIRDDLQIGQFGFPRPGWSDGPERYPPNRRSWPALAPSIITVFFISVTCPTTQDLPTRQEPLT